MSQEEKSTLFMAIIALVFGILALLESIFQIAPNGAFWCIVIIAVIVSCTSMLLAKIDRLEQRLRK